MLAPVAVLSIKHTTAWTRSIKAAAMVVTVPPPKAVLPLYARDELEHTIRQRTLQLATRGSSRPSTSFYPEQDQVADAGHKAGPDGVGSFQIIRATAGICRKITVRPQLAESVAANTMANLTAAGNE